jgi:hypothetical protein
MQKINLNPNAGKGKVIIASNIQKVSERLDIDGNVIDPRTKQIIKPREAESILTSQNNESILRG